jgi:hypothetical protein
MTLAGLPIFRLVVPLLMSTMVLLAVVHDCRSLFARAESTRVSAPGACRVSPSIAGPSDSFDDASARLDS